MAQNDDIYDQLVQAVRRPADYPKGGTLFSSAISPEVKEHYYDQLLEHSKDIFSRHKKRTILFWENTGAKTDSWQEIEANDGKQVADHLLRHAKDPRCRHIFIGCKDPRSPLNCSQKMLKPVLTYHQIGPSFLDCIFTFKDSNDPVDASLSQFLSDDTLVSHSRSPPILTLGRSGREIRHSLLLRSVEKEPEIYPHQRNLSKWPIQQAAVYYSFDVETGNTVWISVEEIKENQSLHKRIMRDTVHLPVIQNSIKGDVAASFEGSLAILLIYLSWCERDLRWYVRHTEERIRDSLLKPQALPIDQHVRSDPWRAKDADTESSVVSLGFEAVRNHIRSRFKASVGHRSKSAASNSELPNDASISLLANLRQEPASMDIIETFNYGEYRELVEFGEELEEVILVVRLNLGVLHDIVGKHKALQISDEIGYQLRKGMAKSIPQFVSKVDAIIRRLETRETQLVSLQKRLSEGKALYENLLQYRFFLVTRRFAELGIQSSLTMQAIAYRTERETISMHIITLVTLVFLPATFLSSVFQSGIIEWRESKDFTGDWLLRKNVLMLFLLICIPMTIIIVLLCFCLNLGRRSQSRRKSDEYHIA